MIPETKAMGRFRTEVIAFWTAVASGTVAYVIWGFHIGIANNEFHFPILLLHRNLATFRGDALAGTLVNFASPLWHLLAELPSSIPIQGILVACFIASRILLAWSFGLLVSSLSPPRFQLRARCIGACLTLALGWIQNLPLGADPVMGTYFSQTFLSVGILVAVLGFVLQGRSIEAAIFLGAGYDVNLMQANFVASMVFPIWLFSEGLPDRRTLKRVLGLGAIVAVFAFPGLRIALQALRSSPEATQLTGTALSDFAAFHIPGHFFWSMKAPRVRIQALALMAIPPILAWFGTARTRNAVKIASIAPVVLFVAQVIFLHFVPDRFLFQLHLFRSDVFCFVMAAGILVGEILTASLVDDHRGICAYVTASAMVFSGNFLSAFGLLISWFAIGKWRGRRKLAGILLLSAAIATILIGFRFPITGIVMFAMGIAILVPIPRPLERIAYPSLTVFMVLSLIFTSYRAWKIDYNGVVVGVSAQSSTYDKALVSAREESSPDDLFTVPPSHNTRAILQRGVYYSIWDGAGFLWFPGHELEVLRRMRVLGIPYTPGIQYLPEAVDSNWAAGLCAAIPLLRGEGVTRAILPVRDGRIDPEASGFLDLRLDDDKIRTICRASAETKPTSRLGTPRKESGSSR